MKKLLLLSFTFFSLCFYCHVTFAAGAGDCVYDGVDDVGFALTKCIDGADVVMKGDLRAEDGLKNTLYALVKLIGGILGIATVAALVYASFLLVISQGEEEKVTKAKGIIKWSLIGFLALIATGALITVVINIVYGLAGR